MSLKIFGVPPTQHLESNWFWKLFFCEHRFFPPVKMVIDCRGEMQDWRKIQVWLRFDWTGKLVFIKCCQLSESANVFTCNTLHSQSEDWRTKLLSHTWEVFFISVNFHQHFTKDQRLPHFSVPLWMDGKFSWDVLGLADDNIELEVCNYLREVIKKKLGNSGQADRLGWPPGSGQ